MADTFSAWAARRRVPLGFAAGLVYLIFAKPTTGRLIAGAGVALAGLALRGYAAGCLEKNQKLATTGPYSYTRNPLYLGSGLVGVGFAVAGNSWPLALLFVALFAGIYWPVMLREEDSLRSRFQDEYDPYATRVPFFLPTRGRAYQAQGGFDWRRYRTNREYEAFIGYVAAVVVLLVKLIWGR